MILVLEEAPASGLLQWKVYCSKYANGYTREITSVESTLTFAENMGTITAITLQCKQNSGQVRVKNVKLRAGNGEEVQCTPTVSWGCTMGDITVITGINEVKQNVSSDCRIYDLTGRRLNQKPEKGVYIQNGKKFVK